MSETTGSKKKNILHRNTSLPLPWREGIKGRGNTPTLVLPRQGGGELGDFSTMKTIVY